MPAVLGALVAAQRAAAFTSIGPRRAFSRLARVGSTATGRAIDANLPEVTLTIGKSRLFKDGNPLVYGGAVDKVRLIEHAVRLASSHVGHQAALTRQVKGSPVDGRLVNVFDHRGNFIGSGPYNSASMYRVRLLKHAGEKAFADVTGLGACGGAAAPHAPVAT